MPELGSIHRARVVSCRPFGAFVALEGFRPQGLVHISQLADQRVQTVDEVVREDDEVRVLVLSVDNGRLSCSLRQVDQETGERREGERGGGRGGSGGGGGGGGRGGGGSDAMPELYSIHRVEVAKLESFGAFCRLPGLRKQGLLHISQISNTRIEADDLPHILAVDETVFVKVIGVDESNGRIALSAKLVSQGDGRDLDPSHAEAQAEGDRGGGRRRETAEEGREKQNAMAAMQVIAA